jgi:hypothetical protein
MRPLRASRCICPCLRGVILSSAKDPSAAQPSWVAPSFSTHNRFGFSDSESKALFSPTIALALSSGVLWPMRFPLPIVVLLAVVSSQAVGQHGFCPATPELGNTPFSEHWLDGSMGRRSVRMYLARGGEAVVGTFYYAEDWVPQMLGGRWEHSSAIHLTNKTNESPGTGNLEVRLTTNGLRGTWTSFGSSQKLPVRLKPVPQPHSEAGSGPWKRFNDRRWPITFSYPASWRATVSNNRITLTPPDPALMAYEGFDISFTQGTMTQTEDIGFVQCGNQWYDPACDCEDLSGLFCDTAAPISKSSGMTILDGDRREWRGHCRDGGYFGQSDGHLRVILINDRWVQLQGQGMPSLLIDRIVSTARRRP